MRWTPQSEPQRLALACPARLLLFGGAAGSLKSETLLIDAARERDNPRLRAILFRRSFPELEKSLIRRSRELYGAMGASFHETKHLWNFPSGALVEFGHIEAEKDIYRYQGAEYSFIGWDESTHFAEEPVRYMTSRLRSTDPALRLRVRLASNPGNVGHLWHRRLFMGPKCSHCEVLPTSRVPGVLYRDAQWPSDGRAVGMSTCYIPGRATDHALLGSSYRATLDALPAKFRQALLDGCWAAFEGQYFDCYSPARCLVRRAEIPERPWWPRWVGADYGFTVSEACAYLLARGEPSPAFPRGRVYVLEEHAAKHLEAAAWSREVWRRLALSGAPTPRKIAAWFLSPDAFSDRGEGHSLADQMREASGVPWQPAAHDRVGGAMLVYSMLGSGELVISDRCERLAEALATRIHDPARPNDVLKQPGDPLDDAFDALRYALYSFIPAARTPEPVRDAREIEGLDPTAAMLRLRKIRADRGERGKPKRYLRGPR